jgi:hypothetical protein
MQKIPRHLADEPSMMRPRPSTEFYISALPNDCRSDGLEKSKLREKKKFTRFLERAMLRPLADDFRPNENGIW